MHPIDKPPNPEREQTDASLRVERERADDGIGEKLAAIEETADAVISKARERADAVLAKARAKTDQARPTSQRPPASMGLQRERSAEDEALRAERARADEALRVERSQHVALLATEREETDKDLLGERAKSDDALATRDDFMGIVSHDLRHLLGVMVGFAGLIGDSVGKPEHVDSIKGHAQRISRAGARMSRLIGDLVDVASIEAGKLGVAIEPNDPAQVTTEAVDSLHAQAAASRITLESQLLPTAPVAFDAPRILQVLTNLVSNAIKFTERGGTIVVRVDQIGSELRFRVSDTGKGIPADKLGAIFDRFQQLDTNDRRGVGLGLYISKCIVQGHGGHIWAESQVGRGSTFSFTIPCGSN